MICPFCQNEVKVGFSEKLRKNIRCHNCRAFVDKDANWRNVNGLTVFDLRLQNLPAEGSFQKVAASGIGFFYENERHGYETIQYIDFIWNHAEVKTSLNLVPIGKYDDHTSKLKIIMFDGSCFVQKAGTRKGASNRHIYYSWRSRKRNEEVSIKNTNWLFT